MFPAENDIATLGHLFKSNANVSLSCVIITSGHTQNKAENENKW